MTDVPTSTVVRALVVGAVVVGTAGFMTAGKTVTVAVDGEARQVHTYARTVAEVLDAEGLAVGEHDTVVPSAGAPVGEGGRIDLRRGRLVLLTVDGRTQQIWTTAGTIAELTTSLGSRFLAASWTASRSQRIPLTGLVVDVSLPKEITIAHDGVTSTLVTTAPTVGAAIVEAGLSLDGRDLVRPRSSAAVASGMSVRVVRVVQRKMSVRSKIAYQIRTKADSSLYKGQVKVLRAGTNGVRVTTYLVTTHDGKVASRQRVSVRVLRVPTDRVVAYGTRARPTSTASGGGVDSLNWPALARCESSGNPRAVGGGGLYFGLYQFTLGTWHGVGGVGNPIDASPAEQTYRAKLLYRNRGSAPWPVCGRLLYT